MRRRRGRAGEAAALGAALLLAACASPLGAPAETGRTTTAQSSAAAAPQARRVLPVDPTATAVRPVFVATTTPAAAAPLVTPLAPTVSPIAPALPTLTLAPRAPLDVASREALDAVIGTATAQAVAALATAQALPAQEIVMRDLTFTPAALTVKPGTTIVWRNQDRVQHHVTGGEFDSGRIHGGSQWAQVIGRPGLYQFLCSFHPTMRAEITVSTDDTRPLHLGS